MILTSVRIQKKIQFQTLNLMISRNLKVHIIPTHFVIGCRETIDNCLPLIKGECRRTSRRHVSIP